MKKIFKLNNWKRWFILSFIFISCGLFIGLSFGLKSKDSRLSNDYKNGVSLVVKPTINSGNEINNETYSKQLLYNFQKMLEDNLDGAQIYTEFENPSVWKLDILNSDENSVKNILNNPKSLNITSIDFNNVNNNVNFIVNSNNPFFNNITNLNNEVSFVLDRTSCIPLRDQINSAPGKNEKIIIWKNLEQLTQIINDPINSKEYGNGNYQSFYDFLFVDGWTPEKVASKGENDTTMPAIFKDSLSLHNKNGKVVKTYLPKDFLVSINNKSDYDFKTSTNTMKMDKSFGVSNSEVEPNDYSNDFYNITFWLGNYKINDYVLNPFVANNGSNASLFLVIALTSVIALLSIFVVINYGYLGIFAILLMAVVIFLSLLMVSVFIGDYDSIGICAILASAFVLFDFMVVFFEKVKSEFLKGSSISKAIKNTIKNERNSIILKSIILLALLGTFYGIISLIFGVFSSIILITSIVSVLILIPSLIAIAILVTNINVFSSNPKTIGFWSKKYKEFVPLSTSELSIDEQINVDETIQIDSEIKANNKIVSEYRNKKIHRYGIFKKDINSRGLLIVITTISYIFIVGLVVFLFGFIKNGATLRNGFYNQNPNNKNQTVLRISKADNTKFDSNEINEIKKILVNNSFDQNDISVEDNQTIKAIASNDFAAKNINNASLEIYGMYDVVIIPSNLISSQTYKIMKFTLLAALIAIVVMCIFVLFWMGWSKALPLLFVSLISFASFIFMTAFGLIQINSMLSVVATIIMLLFAIMSINLLIKVHYKLKTKRIEELITPDIKEIVNKQVFKMVKPITIFASTTFLTFVIFALFASSLSFTLAIFVAGSIIVNYIYVIFLLPRIIIWLESRRANMRRKMIINSYWDTEKIKEQVFKGINNIK